MSAFTSQQICWFREAGLATRLLHSLDSEQTLNFVVATRRSGRVRFLEDRNDFAAVREITQGLARKFDLCVLCSYDIDCEPVADLRRDAGRARHHVKLSDMRCAWFLEAAADAEPASWRIADRLIAEGYAGLLTPSFAPGATRDAHNLVLWKWSANLPTKVAVYDPSSKLPPRYD